MPIEFRCPFCDTPYRLKDELAGKTARCKSCRQVMTVPQPKPPAAAEPLSPPPPVLDADSMALSALTDEPPKQEETPAEQRTVPMVCTVCEHKWIVPFSMSGKNVLCPECQQRQKVPEPKKEEIRENWRDARSKLPSLAKENFDKPTDVQDAQSTMVSGRALVEAGAIEEDLEPVPLGRKLFWYGTPVALAALLVAGGWLWSNRRVEKHEQRLVDTALVEFAAAKDDEKPPPAEVPLFDACLHIAAGEYALRVNQPKSLKDAYDHFTRARDELRLDHLSPGDRKNADMPARNALLGKLALAQLDLGGTPEQVTAQTRYRWVPDTTSTRTLRINERVFTVHQELQRTLQWLQPAEFDQKTPILRRLTRELVKRGQPDLAEDLAVMFFKPDEEQPEARAIVALEILRADKASPKPLAIAEELGKQILEDLRKIQEAEDQKIGYVRPKYFNHIGAVQMLWHEVVKPPPKIYLALPATLPTAGPATDAQLVPFVGVRILEGQADEALALIRRSPGTKPEVRLRALALFAEWVADPAPALEAVPGVIESSKRATGTDKVIPQYVLARLAQLAARANKMDEAKKMLEAIPDADLRDWCRGEFIRERFGPSSKDPADAAMIELPDDHQKLRVGHAWGRLLIARQMGKLSGKNSESKQVAGWPTGSIHPFGLAGFALGLQDREQTP